MLTAQIKVLHLRWWNLPIRLYTRKGGKDIPIGWVWNRKVRVYKDMHPRWVAFVEDQLELDDWCCQHCGRALSSELQSSHKLTKKLLQEWVDKTGWLQERFNRGYKLGDSSVLGEHRADVARKYIEHLEREIKTLQCSRGEGPK
jgi:hypothetical protein